MSVEEEKQVGKEVGQDKANKPDDAPIIFFANQAEWEAWLEAEAENTKGVWVQLAKKAAPYASVSYFEAVEVALCFGWIDGPKRRHDEYSSLQKFTPRRPKSIWSKINREKAQALIASGRMRPSGMRAIEAAQKDGRWDAAYDPPSTAVPPDDLQAALDANEEAKHFFQTLTSSNRFAIIFRVQQAKRPETRAKRIRDFVAMLARHEKIYP